MRIIKPKLSQVKTGMILEWTDGIDITVVGSVSMKDGRLVVSTRPNMCYAVEMIIEHGRDVVAYPTNQEFELQLLTIAKRHFHVDTLEVRHRDSLDFHDVSVWAMKAALEEAYQLGKKSK